MKKNIIVGQSGGPTAAINATLAGVIRGASADENIEKIYGMVNGIQGLLEGNVRVLNGIFDDEMNPKLLRNTPAAALGSCRLRLPDVDSNNQDDMEKYEKIFSFLEEKNIKYFLYIGGNDSMDTVQKLSCYAERNNIDVKIIGIPKTVDNDLVGTDHTPGFGSAAKYTATTLHEICHDNEIYNMKSIVIVEIMGRDAGWLTASAALPRLYGWKAPNLVYLPEIEFSDERFVADIAKEFEKRNDIVIAVSEGLKYANGRYVCENIEHETDIFGHKQLSGTADCLKYIAKERFGCKVRAVELNTPQRCASHIASARDLSESEEIGFRAVEAAAEGKTGIMMGFRRLSSKLYKVEISREKVENTANKIKTVPLEYINSEKNNVTDECLRYIAPLVVGEPELVYLNGIPKFFSFDNK